jgi:hypothetical protein
MTDVGWTTRFDPEITNAWGVPEAHFAYFEPSVWSERRTAVVLLIPECELQFAQIVDGEPVVMINRPQNNKNIKTWTRNACEIATDQMAFLSFTCDTAEEAERAARRAAKLLPKHKRVALERMYDVASRERGRLS